MLANTTTGVSANAEGFYKITINQPNATLVVSAVGYVPQVVEVTTSGVLNIALREENYTLKNVEIRANAEDPAYGIMRKAIAQRKTHLQEINSYTVDVYTKGLQKLVAAPKRFLGRDMKKTLDLDENGEGILYLSETQSKFGFKLPNHLHEEMLSSKVAGKSNAFSFNKASDLNINFYNNLVLEGHGLSSRSFVSPLADNALFYYHYKLLGNSTTNGTETYKIAVSPRRKNDPCFRGVIYIADETWRLMGTNLNLTADVGLNFVDTLNITQQYVKTGQYFMPASMKFAFSGKVLKFKFEGYYVGLYTNYKINPTLPHDYFTKEILHVNKYVNQKDSIFWINARPIPLTTEETSEYHQKDSIALRTQSKTYLDSIEQAKNKFSIGKILITPYTHHNRYNHRFITFDPISSSIFYNTVEGLALKYAVRFQKDLVNSRYYYFKPEARYGFKSHLFTANATAGYYYDATKRAMISLSAGSTVADLNRYGSNSLRSNTINSLLFETNLSKFYKKEFVNIATTRELATGLQASLDINWERNQTLTNNTTFTFRDVKDKAFTSNNPFTPNAETPLFPAYKSLSATLTASYTFGQHYITRPDGKIYEPSKYPRIQGWYRKGFNGILGSAVDYDFIGGEISQEKISWGLVGYSSIALGAGKFLNAKQLYYPDYKHFWGNSSTLFPPNLRRFRYLDFYIYATNRAYFEGHFEHNFAGFITNKIPLIRKLKLEEFAGVNYLSTPHKRDYQEYYFGLQRLVLSVSYGWAFDGHKKVDQGFRIAYSF